MIAQVFVTKDWSNLNPEKFYVVTAGIYQSESEANAALASAQSFCADALCEVIPEISRDEITKIK